MVTLRSLCLARDQRPAGVCLRVVCLAFSSPEATILLVSTKNQDLLPVPIFEHVQSTSSVIFSQSDLPDLKMSQLIMDFQCWGWPEVLILGADENGRGLWGRECVGLGKTLNS